MIDRYEIQDISSLWNQETKFKTYLEVELAHLKILEEDGIAESGTHELISKASIDINRIEEIERITHHDVIAFCTSITEQFPAQFSQYFHFGLTSSDIIDTAHALLIKKSMRIIYQDLLRLKSVLWERVQLHKNLLCLGRSHGINAEAMIFGQKFLSFYAELNRRINDWDRIQNSLTGQTSGAVGNYTILSPLQEERILRKLGLQVETVSTQVIPRDHYARIISVGALIASFLERMSCEFRLLQHSDINEAYEGFSKGQKGSSTMPHKKNPISSENISGICRVIRSHLHPSLENCVLWHERDISHSSVERMMLPDHFGLLAYAIRRMENVVSHLQINEENMTSKVENNSQIFSSYILHQLLRFNPEVKREEIYEIVQASFFKTTQKEDLKNELLKNCKHLHHQLEDWLDFSQLKKHYQNHFQEVLNRFS